MNGGSYSHVEGDGSCRQCTRSYCYTQTSNCEDDGITEVRTDLTNIDACCGDNNKGVGVSFRNPLDGTCYNCGTCYNTASCQGDVLTGSKSSCCRSAPPTSFRPGYFTNDPPPNCCVCGSAAEDPHFFLPLQNGDYMCFSVQGIPDFAFNLISDKYIQFNAVFVLPAEEESQTIANVSTFLGDLGLVVKNPRTGNTTVINVTARDHSVKVDNSLVFVKDKPVTVKVSNGVQVIIVSKVQPKLKDASAWLSIETEAGIDFEVKFYKKHLDMLLTRTTGLTKDAHGLIGQFFNSDVKVDSEHNLMKFQGRKPISVKKAPAWSYLKSNVECWYGKSTDNQATGVIEGTYTDYIVQNLFAQNY
ncbi:inter-alpha-trypsin inhibitor heavy chain H5-like [Dysidea avara]|uniref:inter-alpha-trypsin inhibitor heavy chain H5-like n=1 Tax=Dysidea avara TaxID=196820 RepID=UPI003324D08C